LPAECTSKESAGFDTYADCSMSLPEGFQCLTVLTGSRRAWALWRSCSASVPVCLGAELAVTPHRKIVQAMASVGEWLDRSRANLSLRGGGEKACRHVAGLVFPDHEGLLPSLTPRMESWPGRSRKQTASGDPSDEQAGSNRVIIVQTKSRFLVHHRVDRWCRSGAKLLVVLSLVKFCGDGDLLFEKEALAYTGAGP